MPRGRLIYPMLATIARLDTVANEAAGNYDDDFREPIKRDSNADGLGEEQREEQAEIQIKAQIETDRGELQRLAGIGDVPDSAIGLVVHLRELEAASLFDTTTGELAIHKNDRLVKIDDKRGRRVRTFDRVPVFCYHARLLDGWIGRTANLALLLFSERPAGYV